MAGKTCWTAERVRDLGLVTNLEIAGRILAPLGTNGWYLVTRRQVIELLPRLPSPG